MVLKKQSVTEVEDPDNLRTKASKHNPLLIVCRDSNHVIVVAAQHANDQEHIFEKAASYNVIGHGLLHWFDDFFYGSICGGIHVTILALVTSDPTQTDAPFAK